MTRFFAIPENVLNNINTFSSRNSEHLQHNENMGVLAIFPLKLSQYFCMTRKNIESFWLTN